MSDFPYTDEQVRYFSKAMGYIQAPEVQTLVRRDIQKLLDAGITVTFPEPRFHAEWSEVGQSWRVSDRHRPGAAGAAASFYGLYAEQYAREHADRLNREVQSC